MSRVNVAVVGAGRMGTIHVENLRRMETANLAAVVDIDPTRSSWNDPALIDVLDDPTIRAVVIATPTEWHADVIKQAAIHGKAIFCEKPISLDLRVVESVLEVVERTRAHLMIGFQRRFDPVFTRVALAVNRGDIGEVEFVSIISRDVALPSPEFGPTSGGIFHDWSIHDLDMARWLLPSEPVRVSAQASQLVPGGSGSDTASITLTTEAGVIAQITNGRRVTYGYDQRIEVAGSLGIVAGGNPSAPIVVANESGFVSPVLVESFADRYQEAYRSELVEFVNAVAGHRAPWPNGDDGHRASVLAVAAIESSRTGRTVEVES